MNLVIDIGNTRAKAAIFDKNVLIEKANWPHCTLGELSKFAEAYPIQGAILSSVIPVDATLTKYLSERYRFIELSAKTPVPFRNEYQTPETLGKDRIAAVAGAYALFKGQNVLIIDCGTCIKYEVLTAAGIYIGGNIAPGAKMRIQAMHHFTAKLPEVAFHLPKGNIGNNTETALQNGALLGAMYEIESYAKRLKKQLKKTKVVMTGGDADFFAKNTHIRGLFVDADIVLKGLDKILQYNNPTTNN